MVGATFFLPELSLWKVKSKIGPQLKTFSFKLENRALHSTVCCTLQRSSKPANP